MAGIIGVRAEDMEQVDALQRARLDWPKGLPLIRPHVLAPVLVKGPEGLTYVAARFGLSRRFASFNARDDRLTESVFWRTLFGKDHGIVPVSYVVEWVGTERTGRQPYLIQRADGRMMMVPALVGTSRDDAREMGFALCTRKPNGFFARFHDRMIGHCSRALMERWLTPVGRTDEELLECVAAPGDDELVAVPTSPEIQKRQKGDWSPLPAIGPPLTWGDVQQQAVAKTKAG